LADTQCSHGKPGCIGAVEDIVDSSVREFGTSTSDQREPPGAPCEQRGARRGKQCYRHSDDQGGPCIREPMNDDSGVSVTAHETLHSLICLTFNGSRAFSLGAM